MQVFDNHEDKKGTKELLKIEFGVLENIGGRKFLNRRERRKRRSIMN